MHYAAASSPDLRAQSPEQVPEPTPLTPTADGGTACYSRRLREALKVRRETVHNIHTVESRIRYMQREEAQIWHELDEAQRQINIIEGGRSRQLDKRLSESAIRLEQDAIMEKNRARVLSSRDGAVEQRRRSQFETMRSKEIAGKQVRETSQDMIRKRKVEAEKAREKARERAAAIRKEQELGRQRIEVVRAKRMAQLVHQKQDMLQKAEEKALKEELLLEELEQREAAMLHRLQNSRLLGQSRLQEMEASLVPALPKGVPRTPEASGPAAPELPPEPSPKECSAPGVVQLTEVCGSLAGEGKASVESDAAT